MSPLERLWTRRRDGGGPEPGMVRAEDLPRARREAAPAVEVAGPSVDPALAARRERLAERLTLMQLELGGVFYEMAIRDHVQMEVLLARAAALQKVDTELAHVDELLVSGKSAAAGVCSGCQATHARGAAFCWQCGSALDREPDAPGA